MQRRGSARGLRGPSPELQRALPIAWVHVPKCGSSFINTLIHLPGVCPGLPRKLQVSPLEFGPMFLGAFQNRYNLKALCPGLLEAPAGFDHKGIESRWTNYSKAFGHMMIMLRQPERRLVSAYNDMATTCAFSNPNPIRDESRSWGGWPNLTLPSMPDYARRNRGCATRMLTRPGTPCGGSGGPPTEDEVAEAKRRLREGFTFVGITDQWALSVCLFSAMFRVPCHGSQFLNTRPGLPGPPFGDSYAKKMLGGVTDPYDGELYEEAVQIFKENLRRYNVTSSCLQCWAKSAVTLLSTSSEGQPGLT